MAVAGAQGILPMPPFDPELQKYLALTDDQVARIQANNRELTQRQATSSLRQFTLVREAQMELAQPAPDAMAVGSRYAEAQRLCREQEGGARQTMERNRAVLTEAQRQKLAELQESARLLSVVGEAQAANIYRGRARVFPGLANGSPSGGGVAIFDPASALRPTCFPGAGVIPASRIVLP